MPSQFERILPGQFMHLTKELRDHLANVFEIKTSGISEVRDQEVISDGRTFEDLAAITKEKMFAYIGSEEQFLRAWELSVAKAYSELHPPVGIIEKKPEVVADPAPAPTTAPVADPAPAADTTSTTSTPNGKEKKGK